MMKPQVAWAGKYTTGEPTAEGMTVTAHVDTRRPLGVRGCARSGLTLLPTWGCLGPPNRVLPGPSAAGRGAGRGETYLPL
jgi:hypothetical protein